MKPIAASEALDHKSAPWLFLVVALTILPNFFHLPIWIIIVAVGLSVWSVWIWHSGNKSPQSWLLAAIVFAIILAMYFEFRALFGREVGTASLLLLLILKTLEIRSIRDHYIIIILSYFLLFTYFFQSQAPLVVLWMLLTLWVLTAALIRLQASSASYKFLFKFAAQIIGLAIPFMLIFYVLFPRAAGPLWGLPEPRSGITKGLSEFMSPGDIASLAENEAIAFRVKFTDLQPAPSQLYWRGLVMEKFDGREWRYEIAPELDGRSINLDRLIDYNLILEPHGLQWIPSLETLIVPPTNAQRAPGGGLRTFNPVNQRLYFNGKSSLKAQYAVNENTSTLRRNLVLPKNSNPQTFALAQQWIAAGLSQQQIIDAALNYYRQNNFSYTLQQPTLGKHAVDEFLFSSKQGFCEHYASSFATLMRAANIPARIVTGFQGGEINPLSLMYSIRQSDAHAWVEVWRAGIGWERVDPTSVIMPNRISFGAQRILADAGLLSNTNFRRKSAWLQNVFYQIEAFEDRWNLWVIGYNRDRQKSLFVNLGLGEVAWSDLIGWLIGSVSLAFLLVFIWQIRQQAKIDPVAKVWLRAITRLQRGGYNVHYWQGPLSVLAYLQNTNFPRLDKFAQFCNLYSKLRYGRSDAQQSLFAQLKQLKLLYRQLF